MEHNLVSFQQLLNTPQLMMILSYCLKKSFLGLAVSLSTQILFPTIILSYRLYPSVDVLGLRKRSDGLGCVDLMMKNDLPKNIIFHEYHVKKI